MPHTQTPAAPAAAEPQPGHTIERWDRSWKVLDPEG